MVGRVKIIYKPDWRSLVVTAVDIETPYGPARIRFIYDRRSGTLHKASQTYGSNYKDLGLSLSQVHKLLGQVKKACLWRIKKTDDIKKMKEEVKELRATKKAKRQKKPSVIAGGQQRLPL